MATKLHQLLAIEPGVSAEGSRALTTAQRDSQKDGPLSGLTRVYQPKDEDGDKFPTEMTRVQYTVADLTERMRPLVERWFDVTARKDWANRTAGADVVVNGETLIENAPVSFLLWLEKRLDDLNTYVVKLPTLDPSQAWGYDEQIEQFRSAEVRSSKSRKVQKPVTLYEATEFHPAQTQLVSYDEVIGEWTLTNFSGAITEQERSKLIERVGELRRAVKIAREKANQEEISDVLVGETILRYVFD
jgi:hypothetical protein